MRRTVPAAVVAGVMASAVLSPAASSSPRSYATGHFMFTLDPTPVPGSGQSYTAGHFMLTLQDTPLPAPGNAGKTVVTVKFRAAGNGAALGIAMTLKDTRANADAAGPAKTGITGPEFDAQSPSGPSTSVSVEIKGSSESQGKGKLPKFDLDVSMEGAGSTIK